MKNFMDNMDMEENLSENYGLRTVRRSERQEINIGLFDN